MLKSLTIFTDAAVSQKNNLAIGAFLCFCDKSIAEIPQNNEELSKQLHFVEFQTNKSTYAEIKTFIAAMLFVKTNIANKATIQLYSDCDNLRKLLFERKDKLLAKNFITKSGKVHEHAELYKSLYALSEDFEITFHKIKGHKAVSQRISMEDKIFAFLDKASRQKMRSSIDLK